MTTLEGQVAEYIALGAALLLLAMLGYVIIRATYRRWKSATAYRLRLRKRRYWLLRARRRSTALHSC